MIAYLSGTLLSKHATSAIVDVGGVGYEVAIPLSTFYELGDPGSPVQLRIYTHVREDAIQLFGFKTARERELFLQLISVNGVGPGLAIKFTIRRERPSGSPGERDVFGSQQYAPLFDVAVPVPDAG